MSAGGSFLSRRATLFACALAPGLAFRGTEAQAQTSVNSYQVTTFSDIKSTSVPSDTKFVVTAGYSESGIGSGLYQRTSATGETPYRTKSLDGAWWELSSTDIHSGMVGATANNTDDDTLSLQSLNDRLETSGGSAKILGGYYSTSKGLILSNLNNILGFGATLNTSASRGIILSRPDITLKGMSLTGSRIDEMIAAEAGVKNLSLSDVVIDTTSSTGSGHGIQFNAEGVADARIGSVRVDAKGYGLLVNTNAGGGDGIIATDLIIYAGADAIEINTPGVAFKNAVLWGALLQSNATTGVGAGFSLGLAHVQSFVAGGFVSKRSYLEGLHVEDRCAFGVLANFVLMETGPHGITHQRSSDASLGDTPLVFANFSTQGRYGSERADSAGFHSIWNSNGVNSISPILAGVISGYDSGLWLDGPGLFATSHISALAVNNVLRLGPGGRAPAGALFSENADTLLLVEAGGNAEAGEFHQSTRAPRRVIRVGASPAVPRSTVAGFSFPALDLEISAPAGYSTISLFPVPVRLFGRITVRITSGFGAGIFWEGDTLYDGTNITCSNIISEYVGDLSVAGTNPISVSSDSIAIKIYAARGGSGVKTRVSFKGTYYA